MVWKNETAEKARTPTHELEQVSEDMIEVEEFSVQGKSGKGFLLGVLAALVFGGLTMFVLSHSGTEDAEDADTASPPMQAKITENPKQTSPEKSEAQTTPTQDTKSSAKVPVKTEKADVGDSTKVAATAEVAKPKKSSKKKDRNQENRKRKSSTKKENAKSYDSLMELGAKQLRSTKTAPLAVQTYMAAMRFPEATSEARAKLGRAFLMVGDTKSAIKHLERARKSNPGYRPALWDLARAYQRIQNKDQAISVFRSLANLLDPESRQGQQVARELERMGVTP